MSASNVPDDWDAYWERCPVCGERWHRSEGGHDCPLEDDSWSIEEPLYLPGEDASSEDIPPRGEP